MRRLRWIAAAAALLVLAAWLSSLAESPRPASCGQARVAFPEYPRHEEYERMKVRKTLVLPAASGPAELAADVAEPPAPRKRDPFLAALPTRANDPVLVFEANALRHSRLGELFVRCMLAKDPNAFEKIERAIGIDVLKDVDRVAFVGDAVVVSGFFQRLRSDELERETGASPTRHGEAGMIYAADDGPPSRRFSVGTWRDQIVVLAEDLETVRRALDQIEGRAPAPPIELPDDIAYGEAYGIITGDALRRILGHERVELADRLAAAATRIELHADAMQDIAAVAQFGGNDASALSDLAKVVGGVLAGARLHAQASGDQRLADLLDQASVVPLDGSFLVRVALPIERVEGWFAGCGQ